jgi:hypothetical protein
VPESVLGVPRRLPGPLKLLLNLPRDEAVCASSASGGGGKLSGALKSRAHNLKGYVLCYVWMAVVPGRYVLGSRGNCGVKRAALSCC